MLRLSGISIIRSKNSTLTQILKLFSKTKIKFIFSDFKLFFSLYVKIWFYIVIYHYLIYNLVILIKYISID